MLKAPFIFKFHAVFGRQKNTKQAIFHTYRFFFDIEPQTASFAGVAHSFCSQYELGLHTSGSERQTVTRFRAAFTKASS